MAGCGRQIDDNIKIAVTTSSLGCIVKELGKEKIDVVTIVPSGMCPRHFDLKPKDAQALSDAKLLLCLILV
ncbi:zinc ABC transporter substrate-binding protein [Candidatus Poribacteria bacterium]|nr:zinc ABC transporter substrate-binding protein [Candidatus Poribacteria bacterium]